MSDDYKSDDDLLALEQAFIAETKYDEVVAAYLGARIGDLDAIRRLAVIGSRGYGYACAADVGWWPPKEFGDPIAAMEALRAFQLLLWLKEFGPLTLDKEIGKLKGDE